VTEPPGKPTEILPRTNDDTWPKDDAPAGTEGLDDGPLRTGLDEAIHRRTGIPVVPEIRPGIRRAI
jgi:hypothetical protein